MAHTRSQLLSPASISTGKLPGIVADVTAMGGKNPVLVVYSNDFSNDESYVANADVVGTITSTQPIT